MVDWTQVEAEALSNMSNVLKTSWHIAATGAAAQIVAMAQIAASIEVDGCANPPAISEVEYSSLRLAQKRAMEGILVTYEGIDIVAAQMAAQAAWDTFEAALIRLLPFAV